MKTFRAADGRLVKAKMTEDELAEKELLSMMTVIMPVLMILVFAFTAGLI